MHPTRTRPSSAPAAALVAFTLAAAPAAAQTGPFADGELLVRAPGVLGPSALYRIDPATGHGEVLVDELFDGYSNGGWMGYDPYRGLVLAYTSWAPTGLFQPRLFGIGPAGSMTDLGFDDQGLRALTPVGDGRVYLYDVGGLKLLDAGDNLQPVLDQGGQPVTFTLDHLAWDPPTNSLIGASKSIATSACNQFHHVVVHRYPLDPAGTQLVGPIECTSFDVGAHATPIGLDPLPGGDLLLTLTAVAPFSDKVFVRIDPATLGTTLWGSSTFDDLNGGVWSPALGRAIVLDDQANELRTYAPGQGGSGTLLAVDVPVGDQTTGTSATNTLEDIELFGSACAGLALSFGTGLAGTGGFVPALSSSTCPTAGAPVIFALEGGVGGGLGVVVVAAASAPFPVFGGTGYVLPPFLFDLGLALSGPTGVGGVGEGATSVPTPADPALLGVPIYTQAGVLDLGAPEWIALSNALELRLG